MGDDVESDPILVELLDEGRLGECSAWGQNPTPATNRINSITYRVPPKIRKHFILLQKRSLPEIEARNYSPSRQLIALGDDRDGRQHQRGAGGPVSGVPPLDPAHDALVARLGVLVVLVGQLLLPSLTVEGYLEPGIGDLLLRGRFLAEVAGAEDLRILQRQESDKLIGLSGSSTYVQQELPAERALG